MKNSITVLAVGDVVGKTGRYILESKLQGLRDTYRIDIVIVNGENAAGGRSITPDIAESFLTGGVDVITTGNHVWDNKDIMKIIDQEPRLIRPANFPDGVRGKGYYLFNYKGYSICVINLMGRTLMTPIDCPFRKFDEIYKAVHEKAHVIIVDFHAEATSEKRALGWYADGRASVVFGTHTHVMTADEEILPQGTGYITDVGMTGAFDSVIGLKKEFAIDRFLYQVRDKFETATGNPKINAILLEIGSNGKTTRIERIIV